MVIEVSVIRHDKGKKKGKKKALGITARKYVSVSFTPTCSKINFVHSARIYFFVFFSLQSINIMLNMYNV